MAEIRRGIMRGAIRTVGHGAVLAATLLATMLAVMMAFAGRSAEAETRYVIYYNSEATPLAKAAEAGFTDIILSFLTVPEGADDPFALVVPDAMQSYLADVPKLKAAGKRVLISFGGGDMKAGAWARVVGREAELAKLIAAFVAQHGLHGVDIDFEITEALYAPPHQRGFDGVALLIALTEALAKALPKAALISHAPQPPYLDPEWQGGPYLRILKAVGDRIDWISVQYYNNRGYDGPARTHVVGEGGEPFATSYINLVEATIGHGWPASKLVVGKPVYKDDAASGHLQPQDVVSEIVRPLRARYGDEFGGLMGWQFSDLTADHRYWNQKIAPVLFGATR